MQAARRFSLLREPILASILKSRAVCIAISIAALMQLFLVALHWPAWQSPIHALWGIPDPGCGLSRALVTLMAGKWGESFRYHAFAPLFLIALTLIFIRSFLPTGREGAVVGLIETIERRTGVTSLLLIGLLMYWLARLLFMGQDFVNLINRPW